MKTKLWRNSFSDQRVTRYYIDSGGQFGDAVSYVGSMGECIGFKRLLDQFEDWELEYADRGYRTVSLDRFVDLGGYGKSIDDVIGLKREGNENPIFHAKLYREHFLGKIAPGIDFEKMMQTGKAQSGQYVIPSTEMIVELEQQRKRNN